MGPARSGGHPFRYPTPRDKIWTSAETVKCVVMSILLVPLIRLVCFQLLCALAGFVGYVMNIGYDTRGDTRMLPRWRRRVIELAYPIISRGILISLGFYRPKFRGVI
jgi:hypothetical protein